VGLFKLFHSHDTLVMSKSVHSQFQMLILGMLFASGFSLCAADRSLAGAMPAGAVALFEAKDFGGFLHKFRKSRWYGAALRSPLFRELEEDPQYRQLQSWRPTLEAGLGIDLWTATEKLLGGKMALGLYATAGGQALESVVAARVRDVTTLNKLHGRLSFFSFLAGDSLVKTTLPGGVDLFKLQNKLHMAIKDNWMVASENRLLLSKVVKMMNGQSSRSIAMSEVYKKHLKEIGNWHFANLFVDLKEISKQTGARLGIPVKMENGSISWLLHGMAELAARSPYMSATLDVNQVGFALKAEIPGKPEALGANLTWFFSDPKMPGAPDIPVVPGLIGGISIYRDFNDWYERRGVLLANYLLPEFDKFESVVGSLYQGKDFEREVASAIGPTISLVSASQNFENLDGTPEVKLPGFAMIFDLNDTEKGARFFRAMFPAIMMIANYESNDLKRQAWAIEAEAYKGTRLIYMKFLNKPKGNQLPLLYNFQPVAVQVGDKFVLSSSLRLAKSLVVALQKPGHNVARVNRNFNCEVQSIALARVIYDNRDYLMAQAVRQGYTIAQTKWGLDTTFQVLSATELLRLSTQVFKNKLQMKLEGNWK